MPWGLSHQKVVKNKRKKKMSGAVSNKLDRCDELGKVTGGGGGEDTE